MCLIYQTNLCCKIGIHCAGCIYLSDAGFQFLLSTVSEDAPLGFVCCEIICCVQCIYIIGSLAMPCVVGLFDVKTVNCNS
jgi:hypothetical protein